MQEASRKPLRQDPESIVETEPLRLRRRMGLRFGFSFKFEIRSAQSKGDSSSDLASQPKPSGLQLVRETVGVEPRIVPALAAGSGAPEPEDAPDGEGVGATNTKTYSVDVGIYCVTPVETGPPHAANP